MKASELIEKLQKHIKEVGHDVEVAVVDREGSLIPMDVNPCYDPETGDVGLDGDCFNYIENWAGREWTDEDEERWGELNETLVNL